MPPTSCSPPSTPPRGGYHRGAGPIVVLSDTVGFIRDLPHALVAAFQATLEETAKADLLLHVVDSASPDRDQQIMPWVRY
jgi:GTP-binding protein HflX